MKTELSTLKGFRDLLPQEAVLKQQVVNCLIATFESFGFQPVETPTIEYSQTLLGRYGKNAEKLVYTFKDRGGRSVGLRYDLTVPICKVMGMYQNKITTPFKRYQIQNVFRADKPQRGRYREFTQCDIDIFGVDSPFADGEIIAVTYTALINLGFKQFTININSRKILYQILKNSSISDKSKQLKTLQIIDKLDKKPKKAVEEELSMVVSSKTARSVFCEIEKAKPNKELQAIFNYLEMCKVPPQYYQFRPFLVRGLDYYTGAIFETTVSEPKIGSITGGGRYDNLVSTLGGPDISGTGTTIGLERIIEAMKENHLWEKLSVKKSVLVTIFSPGLEAESISLSQTLRQKGINVELYLDSSARLEKQFKYADRKKIDWVVVIGPNEAKKGKVILKNLENRSQELLSKKELIRILKNNS
jgi:histidyl-tRNA synthetase